MSDYHTWRPHPWHGLSPGPEAPHILNAFIEITPFDLVKYLGLFTLGEWSQLR